VICPDVNVLIYAHRREFQFSDAADRLLEELFAGEHRVGLSVLVLGGFLRVATSLTQIAPTALSDALDFVDYLIAEPRAVLVAPGLEHWKITARLCASTRATGKVIADAQHAAVAIEHGATWLTADGDFARFAKLGLKLQKFSP
jgi:uncharacterized protein